jgi:hypothetical protein
MTIADPGMNPCSALRDVVRQFSEALSSFQAVWDALDDIDAHTWVPHKAGIGLFLNVKKPGRVHDCTGSCPLILDSSESQQVISLATL